MADLKESGAIEEEASVVGLLYRPAYYAKTDKKKKAVAEKYGVEVEDIDEIAELEIAKHRNGGVGTIRLKFIGELTRFEGTTEKLYSNNPTKRQGYVPPKHRNDEEED
jgi:replicative DNA helicase